MPHPLKSPWGTLRVGQHRGGCFTLCQSQPKPPVSIKGAFSGGQLGGRVSLLPSEGTSLLLWLGEGVREGFMHSLCIVGMICCPSTSNPHCCLPQLGCHLPGLSPGNSWGVWVAFKTGAW